MLVDCSSERSEPNRRRLVEWELVVAVQGYLAHSPLRLLQGPSIALLQGPRRRLFLMREVALQGWTIKVDLYNPFVPWHEGTWQCPFYSAGIRGQPHNRAHTVDQ